MTRDGLHIPAIIPAIRNPEQWESLGEFSPGSWVFILGGALDDVAQARGLLHKRGWTVFVHLDMIRGLSKDAEGVQFFCEYAGPDGLITTHSSTVSHIKRLGILAVQRMFLLDSQSVTTGIQQVLASRPDAVELMPGLLPGIARKVVSKISVPVIAGGLVQTRRDVERMRAAGVSGVSTSTRSLWKTLPGEETLAR